MSTLRVLLTAVTDMTAGCAWTLYDDRERAVRSGHGPAPTWPAADRREAVLAAALVRLARLVLPPMPADRVMAAAAYALEDRLASPAETQHLVASPRARDGGVEVTIAARGIFPALVRDFARVVAEPAVAPLPPAGTWRWYPSAGRDSFVRRADGSAFTVARPAVGAALPAELELALAGTTPDAPTPTRVEVAFDVAPAALAAWSQQTGIAFTQATAWRWDVDPQAIAAATDLLQGDFGRTAKAPRAASPHALRTALSIAAAALAIHVAASGLQWAAWAFESWQVRRGIVAVAREAGVNDVSTSTDAATALRDRFAQARHHSGRAAPADALPLLARAAPALAQLPAGALKNATYTANAWTLDLVRIEPDIAARLDARLVAAGLDVVAAPAAAGVRMRLSPTAGAELP